MKISFCTVCMNRSFHLKKSYIQNIKDNEDYEDVEFVLLDYGSTDDLQEYVRNDLKEYIKSGKVKFVSSNGHLYYHMSRAKNMAHMASTGDIICNLDSDNITGKGFASWVIKKFKKNKDIVICSNDSNLVDEEEVGMRGAFGRIALLRENYLKLKGYDEDFIENVDDLNLISRAEDMGLKRVDIPKKYLKAVQHNDAVRIVNLVGNIEYSEILSRNLDMDYAKGQSGYKTPNTAIVLGQLADPLRLKITFVTTCFDQLKELKVNYKQNILDNIGLSVNFILLDWNSLDGTKEYIEKEFSKFIESGRLIYKYTDIPYLYNEPYVKNVAMRLAKADILCDLEPSVKLGKDFWDFIHEEYKKDKYKFLYKNNRGVSAFRLRDFMRVGGYNERSNEAKNEFCTRLKLELPHLKPIKIPAKFMRGPRKKHIKNTVKQQQQPLILTLAGPWDPLNMDPWKLRANRKKDWGQFPEKKEIVICMIATQSYFVLLETAIYTLTQSNSNIILYILSVDIEKDSKRELLEMLWPKRVEVEWIEIGTMKNRFNHLKHIPKRIKKLLYLDVDVLINSSLTWLFDLEFSEAVAGVKYGRTQNKGVMLFNMDIFRRKGIGVIEGDWKLIPETWNYIPRKSKNQANPNIIHFEGEKPLKQDYSGIKKYYELFQHAYKQSDTRDRRCCQEPLEFGRCEKAVRREQNYCKEHKR